MYALNNIDLDDVDKSYGKFIRGPAYLMHLCMPHLIKTKGKMTIFYSTCPLLLTSFSYNIVLGNSILVFTRMNIVNSCLFNLIWSLLAMLYP